MPDTMLRQVQLKKKGNNTPGTRREAFVRQQYYW